MFPPISVETHAQAVFEMVATTTVHRCKRTKTLCMGNGLNMRSSALFPGITDFTCMLLKLLSDHCKMIGPTLPDDFDRPRLY